MKTYTIRTGASFRVSDTRLLTGGETVELEDDVAAAHADKLEPLPAEPSPQTSAPTLAAGES